LYSPISQGLIKPNPRIFLAFQLKQTIVRKLAIDLAAQRDVVVQPHIFPFFFSLFFVLKAPGDA
jgi:hypothetical protein